MSDTDYTPGPWAFVESEGFGDIRFYVSQADGAPYTPDYSDVATLIAETCAGDRVSIQKANAQLIAAAPEMLEALEVVMRCGFDNEDQAGWGEINITREDWDAVVGAIAKALGNENP